MPDTLNPYAPPNASLDPRSGENLWRDGKVLVMRPGSILPPRCVKCNEAAELPIKQRKFYWHEPWIYVFAITCLLIYALVCLVARKQAVLGPGLCPVHRKRRWLGIALGWGGSLLALFLMFLGGTYNYFALLVIGLVLFLGAILAGFLLSRLIQPARIDPDFVRLKGCGRPFLDSLPQFHG